ncbi:GNAT family N-acetyltransferase [Streptomyces sp. 4N509B]|uniref:GNAT family N-acetyltransferase n=1 Tax=Streptomyces sp. 4N509B TaxID=3457413 RepID=UPI003FD249A8
MTGSTNGRVPEDEAVRRIREFNRDYTRLIGALDYEHRLGTPYSLPQARVLYELAQRDRLPVTELRRELEMDAGQLSRLLTRAEEDGLLTRRRDPDDSRRQLVELTTAGRAAAATLERRSTEVTGTLVRDLTTAERELLLSALGTVSGLLRLRPAARRAARPGDATPPYRLRPPLPGELGWVVQRHGALYAAEYGWNAAFETLVADVVSRYAHAHDPAREALWIAELDGAPVGSVLCVDEAREHEVALPTARLRLLLIEPHARGLGLGRALVEECLRFARRAGYARMVLWTNERLGNARRIYESVGFRLSGSVVENRFGREETAQDWELDLATAPV